MPEYGTMGREFGRWFNPYGARCKPVPQFFPIVRESPRPNTAAEIRP